MDADLMYAAKPQTLHPRRPKGPRILWEASGVFGRLVYDHFSRESPCEKLALTIFNLHALLDIKNKLKTQGGCAV